MIYLAIKDCTMKTDGTSYGAHTDTSAGGACTDEEGASMERPRCHAKSKDRFCGAIVYINSRKHE